MKVYVHIYNGSEVCDERVQTTVECDAAPRKGDVFYLAWQSKKALEEQAKELGRGDVYDFWYYGQHKILSFDDAIYVLDVYWMRDDDGIYKCHIELSDGIRENIE